ncbi:MAG: DUF1553 domain-containing protein [Terracidiphilus sp.]
MSHFASHPAGSGVHPGLEAVLAPGRGGDAVARGRIDELVFAHLAKAGVASAGLSSDEVFLRRACLDTIGTLPTAQEAATFLASTDPKRRTALIDQLLQRDEFPVYWAMKWSDLLRIKAEFPINLWPTAAQEYYRWLRESLEKNKPYDQFARELLTSSGSNFRVGPVNFYRALQNREPQSLAQAVALTFLGVRTEKWPAARRAAMAIFFSQVGYKTTGEWKEEIVFFDRSKSIGTADAVFPDGSRTRLQAGRDPRLDFADWLTGPRNPYFARNIVNRIWAWLYGRGIVEEPDDMRPDNPPLYPDLLAFLEAELVSSSYDLKHIYRLILNSSTYQLSSIPRSAKPEAAKNFDRYPLRRLDAEVLIDALNQITGTTEQYFSAVPEPYTIMPNGERAIALPDGSISSSFLELFGRSPRSTGMESERNNLPTSAQRLYLLNSSQVERRIEQGPALQDIFRKSEPRAVLTGLYLTILSRYPTEEEVKIAMAYTQSSGLDRRKAAIDVTWALINSTEFLYRH